MSKGGETPPYFAFLAAFLPEKLAIDRFVGMVYTYVVC